MNRGIQFDIESHLSRSCARRRQRALLDISLFDSVSHIMAGENLLYIFMRIFFNKTYKRSKRYARLKVITNKKGPKLRKD